MPCKENIECIQNFPRSKTIKNVRKFLDMANFFRRFIKEASDIIKPLYDLTKSKALSWNLPCEIAFQKLKSVLSSPLILSYPQFHETATELILTADASNMAAGAVLTQVQGEGEKVLSYASAVFSPAKKTIQQLRKIWPL